MKYIIQNDSTFKFYTDLLNYKLSCEAFCIAIFLFYEYQDKRKYIFTVDEIMEQCKTPIDKIHDCINELVQWGLLGRIEGQEKLVFYFEKSNRYIKLSKIIIPTMFQYIQDGELNAACVKFMLYVKTKIEQENEYITYKTIAEAIGADKIEMAQIVNMILNCKVFMTVNEKENELFVFI